MKQYTNISDEQIIKELANPKKLLILGKTGSGKTKLVNRILRQIENQPETIYLFVTHDLINHTGENSYGHINAERLHIDELETYIPGGMILDAKLANTVIEFPYDELPNDHEKHHILITFINLFLEVCHIKNKRLIMVTDDVSTAVNTIVYALSDDNKCVQSVINLEDINKEFQDLESEGVHALSRFNQWSLN